MSETDFEGYLKEQFSDEPQEQEQETPVTEEVVAEETPKQPVEETPAEPELILGKYKTVEDALKALEHSQREIGRLGQELGELRQQTQQPQAPRVPVDPSTVEDAFVQNPAAARQAAQAAATRALEQGDRGVYEQIIETWGQYDQFGALRFDSARQTAELKLSLAQEIQPQIQTAQSYAEQQATLAAENAVRARHPDFAEVVGNLDEARAQQLIQEGFPVEALHWANGSQAQKEALLETLYRWNKPVQAETVSRATTEAAAEAAAESRQAKQVAAVASASSQPASETISEDDKKLQEFYDFLKAPSPTSWADLRPAGQ